MSKFSRTEYEQLLYSLTQSYVQIRSSSVHLDTVGSMAGLVKGNIWFQGGLELRLYEVIDLLDGEIQDYSYIVFYGTERVRWYDPQPHPENPTLASTFPHHRHEPLDIKHNRQPAPGISFQAPNLPTLIADCIALDESLNPQFTG